MRNVAFIIAGGALVALATAASWPTKAQPTGNDDLRSVASFNGISDLRARSVALFREAGRVLTHPRCVNCHPVSDRPLQGNAGRPHQPAVFATGSGMGSASMPCSSCHGQSNFTLIGTRVGSMLGNPKWHLAPREMAWEGMSLGAICRQIKDTNRNGGRTLAGLTDHSAHDELVAWGWNPGQGREPAPGTQELFGLLVKAWVESGAECPRLEEYRPSQCPPAALIILDFLNAPSHSARLAPAAAASSWLGRECDEQAPDSKQLATSGRLWRRAEALRTF